MDILLQPDRRVGKNYFDQEDEFQRQIRHAYANSKFWKSLIHSHKINIDDIGIKDLIKFPVIDKTIVQKNYSDMLCCPKEAIADYVCTSGTTKSPLHIPLTRNDLKRLAQNECQAISLTGATSKDLFQISTTLDKQFMAGLAYFLGIEKLGAGVIRTGVDSVKNQWDVIQKLKPTYLIAVPSFVVKMIAYAENNKIDINKTSIKNIICIGENIRDQDFKLNQIGKKIKDKWNVGMFSTYASTEMATSFTECTYGMGGHHNPDLIIIEVLDQKNNPTPDGVPGELTITTLGVEGFPLIRYKTGDICTLHTTTCLCGSTNKRISPIVGRTEQRIKHKGTTFYSAAIVDTLNEFEEIYDQVILLEEDSLGIDQVSIFISVKKSIDLKMVKNALSANLRVSPKVSIHEDLVQLRKIYDMDFKRKPVQVIDIRKKEMACDKA